MDRVEVHGGRDVIRRLVAKDVVEVDRRHLDIQLFENGPAELEANKPNLPVVSNEAKKYVFSQVFSKFEIVSRAKVISWILIVILNIMNLASKHPYRPS